jgi:hypothetical protein
MYQAADAALKQNPGLTYVSLMPKPRDLATTEWAQTLGLRETPDWPPRKKFFESKPRGYVLWPKHDPSLDDAADNERVGGVMRRCLNQQYWKGNSITFGDDAHNLAVHHGLNPQMETMWTAGGSSGAGIWVAAQKPTGSLSSGSISSFMYNASSHLFLGRDTDQRNVRRFGEISGGIDPREIEGLVRNLKLYKINGNTISEVLYVDARGPFYCTLLPW